MVKKFDNQGKLIIKGDFDEIFIRKVAESIAKELKEENLSPSILIGRNIYEYFDPFTKFFINILNHNKIKIVDVGMLPPLAYDYLIKEYSLDAGIILFSNTNGNKEIKILSNENFIFHNSFIDRINKSMEVIKIDYHAKINNYPTLHFRTKQAREKYINHLLELYYTDLTGLKIILNSPNEKIASFAKDIFETKGAEVVLLNRTNRVYSKDISFGLFISEDGSKTMFTAQNEGHVFEIKSDNIIAIIANNLKSKGILHNNVIVTNQMSNPALINWAKNESIGLCVTGDEESDINLSVDATQASIGGNSSNYIVLNNAKSGDGILTALTVASIVKESNKTLSELADIITLVPHKVFDFFVTSEEMAIMSNVINKFNNYLRYENTKVILTPFLDKSIAEFVIWAENEEIIETIKEELEEFIKTNVIKSNNEKTFILKKTIH